MNRLNQLEQGLDIFHLITLIFISELWGAPVSPGDSGGPLAVRAEVAGDYRLIGIISGGYYKCAEPGYPAFYTRPVFSALIGSEPTMFRSHLSLVKMAHSVAPPALFYHKELAQGTKSPLLLLLLWGKRRGIFCLSLVLYGIKVASMQREVLL